MTARLEIREGETVSVGSTLACTSMVAEAEPQDVDRLRFIVHAQPFAEHAEVGLHSPWTDSEGGCRRRMRSPADIRTQHLELPACRRKALTEN